MRPNILFILMDDLGWRDLSCYGSSFYETPNLDRLAREGMRFTDAYAACPVCSPTRASILAGKYPARLGVTNYIDWAGSHHPSRGRLIDAPYVKHLPSEECSLARALKEGGYTTWHVGKWHLGGEEYYPDKHGFDVNVAGCEFGCPRMNDGLQGYFSPYGIPTLPDGPAGEYLPDRLGDEAVRLIRAHDFSRSPVYLNYWDYLVHTPVQAKEKDIARFAEKARALGLDRVNPLVEGEPFPCEHKKHMRVTRRVLQSDPAYAAMVWSMDENIGRILGALEEKGQLENTVVVFTSDNGGLATAEGSPTCNAPLQEGKGWMYEGGTREPLLVRWPGAIRAGAVCEAPVTSTDFYPTFLAMAGLPLRPEQHRDGESLMPLLTETGAQARDAIFWHYPHYGNQGGTPGASVRMGEYKLIEFFEDKRVELYNLREDISESRDLAAAEPATRDRLRDRLHAWQAEVEALFPEPNPEWADA